MKRIGTFLAMATMATALVSAQDFVRNQMKVYKVDDASSLVIDGADDEAFWSAPEVQWQEVTKSIFDVAPAGPSDYSLSFKAVYDNDFLYLFFRVKDNVIWTWADHSGDFYNADNIELFFNPSGIHPSEEAPDWDANRDSQLRINIGSDNMATGGGFAATMAVDNEISGFEYTHKVTEEGYDVEVVLPWAAVMPEEYLDMVAEGEIIGFDVNGADADDENGRVKGLSWSADWTDNWRWSAKFGDMTFMGSVTPPTSVEESTEEEISYTFVNGQLTVNNLGENVTVRVCTTLGQSVADLVVSDNAYIDLTSFESNIFVVQVIDGNDAVSFIVSK